MLARQLSLAPLPRSTFSLTTRCSPCFPPSLSPPASSLLPRLSASTFAPPPSPPPRRPFPRCYSLSGHRAASCATPRDPWPPLSATLSTTHVYIGNGEQRVYVCAYVCNRRERKRERERSNNARYSLLRVTITSYSRERLTYLSV